MAGRKKPSRAKVQKRIHAYRGIFKLKPGEKSVVQELLEERRAEEELEERKFQRLAALGKKTLIHHES